MTPKVERFMMALWKSSKCFMVLSVCLDKQDRVIILNLVNVKSCIQIVGELALFRCRNY